MYNLKQNTMQAVSAPDIPFTDEQKSVLNSNEGSIIVNSVAGSGKTTLLQALSFKYPNGLYLAFNKAIVTNITGKLPVSWKCCTFHSLGLSMIKKHRKRASVCFNKMDKYDIPRWMQSLISQHMALAGVNTLASWKNTARRFQVNLSGKTQQIMDYYDLLNNDVELISFDDMITAPLLNQWQSRHYDCVLVDEAQDLSPSQIELLKLIPTDRIIFVGDRNQQIYSWRSSDPEVYDKLEEYYEPAQYQISQCFRCPDLVLGSAREFVPEIWSDISEGSLTRRKTNLFESPDECFILSRNNSPLIEQARRFMRRKVPFSISPQIVHTLNRELRKSKGCRTIKDLKLHLEDRQEHALEMAKVMEWESDGIRERFDMLFEVIRGQSSPSGVLQFVKSMQAYTSKSSKRILLTIHAAKGLESNDVYFINQDMCFNLQFKHLKNNNSILAKEEQNLQYVAITRTLKNLTIF